MLRSATGLMLFIAAACAGHAAEGEIPAGSTSDSSSGRPSFDVALSDLDDSQPRMQALIKRYAEDGAVLERSLMPMSPSRDEQQRLFQQQWLKLLESVDFEQLDQEGRIDYLLLSNHLKHELRELDQARGRDDQIKPLAPFWKTIADIEEKRRHMEPMDPAKSADMLADLSKQLDQAKQGVEKQALSAAPSVARRAAGRVDRLRQALRGWHAFYDGYDPAFTWWTAAPYKRADQDLEEYARLLRAKLVKADEDKQDIVGDPIGREALSSELEYEMIPYSPEELIEIAEKEFVWCEKELKHAAQDLGCGDDWHKALEQVKSLHVAPGDQPELIRKLAVEAIKFLDARDLVTIPRLCRESWRMEMMSPDRQRLTPFFTGGEVISVAYPTAEMTHEEKLMTMRGNNIHFARATAHHELIPGHHLQGLMAARYRAHRELFRTAFLVEGWALYWEMLLWDLEFPQSAEDRIGMLFWRSHRCARIIFSLKFHLGQMSPQEAVDFLVDRVGHERSNALGEVRRSVSGGYGPLYQAAYMLGGLQLRALHRQLVEAGAMTNRQFHDAVLKENSIPIDMIRSSLMGRPLAKDYKPEWRFYDGSG